MANWFIGTGWSCTKSRNVVEAGGDSNIVSVIGGKDNKEMSSTRGVQNINGNNIIINGNDLEKHILNIIRQENKDLLLKVYELRSGLSEGNARIKDLSDRVLYLESSLRENTVTSKEILAHCKELRLEISTLDVMEKSSLLDKIDIIINKTKDIHKSSVNSEEFQSPPGKSI